MQFNQEQVAAETAEILNRHAGEKDAFDVMDEIMGMIAAVIAPSVLSENKHRFTPQQINEISIEHGGLMALASVLGPEGWRKLNEPLARARLEGLAVFLCRKYYNHDPITKEEVHGR